MFFKNVLLAIVFGSFSHCIYGEVKDDSLEKAVSLLMSTDTFYGVYIDTDRKLSPGAWAYSKINSSPDRESYFNQIYQKGKLPGKIYALIGLFPTKKDYVHEEINKLLKEYRTVETHMGSSIEPEDDLSFILKNPHPDTIRLSGNIATVALWTKCPTYNGNGFFVDVYGGAYTDLFNEVILPICSGNSFSSNTTP